MYGARGFCSGGMITSREKNNQQSYVVDNSPKQSPKQRTLLQSTSPVPPSQRGKDFGSPRVACRQDYGSVCGQGETLGRPLHETFKSRIALYLRRYKLFFVIYCASTDCVNVDLRTLFAHMDDDSCPFSRKMEMLVLRWSVKLLNRIICCAYDNFSALALVLVLIC